MLINNVTLYSPKNSSASNSIKLQTHLNVRYKQYTYPEFESPQVYLNFVKNKVNFLLSCIFCLNYIPTPSFLR